MLHTALLDAFPTRDGLGMLARLWLNENLEAITASGSGAEVTLQLITWASSRGRLVELVIGARTANPHNLLLAEFADAWLPEGAPAVLPRPEDGAPSRGPQITVRRRADGRRGQRLLLLGLLLTAGLFVTALRLAHVVGEPDLARRCREPMFTLLALMGAWWWVLEELNAQVRWMLPVVVLGEEAVGASTEQGGLLSTMWRVVSLLNRAKGASLGLVATVPIVVGLGAVPAPPAPPVEPEVMDAGLPHGVDAGEVGDGDTGSGDVAAEQDGPPEPRVVPPPPPPGLARGRHCERNSECASRLCVERRCVVLRGHGCRSDDQCLSSHCEEGTCRARAGSRCRESTDCEGGRCQAGRCALGCGDTDPETHLMIPCFDQRGR